LSYWVFEFQQLIFQHLHFFTEFLIYVAYILIQVLSCLPCFIWLFESSVRSYIFKSRLWHSNHSVSLHLVVGALWAFRGAILPCFSTFLEFCFYIVICISDVKLC
jgi:hypothetical protein